MEKEITVISENLEQQIELTKEDIGYIPTGTKQITDNGEYTIAQYEKVDVQVPGIIPSGTLQITENGTYDVSQYASASVDTPQPSGSISITQNGTVDVTNYETANVNVPAGLSQLSDYSNLFATRKRLSEMDGLIAINHNVSTCSQMFYYFAQNSGEQTTIDLRNFDTSTSTDASNMFYYCDYLLATDILGLEDLDFGNAENMETICCRLGYSSARNLTLGNYTINLSKWKPKKVQSLKGAFQLLYNRILTTGRTLHLNLSNWNLQNCLSLQSMLSSAKITSVDFTNWNTSAVTDMSSMFSSCTLLTELDLSSFTTPALTTTSSMFAGCSKLTRIDMRNFDFGNVTSYSNMFQNVLNDCLIIVKDNTQKTWITSKFSNLTNVKTVAEL